MGQTVGFSRPCWIPWAEGGQAITFGSRYQSRKNTFYIPPKVDPPCEIPPFQTNLVEYIG